MQKIINIDSQILSSIMTCPKKTKLSFIDNIRPAEKASALEKGELIHLPLEIYYSLMGSCANLESSTYKDLFQSGISTVDKVHELELKSTEDRQTKIIDLAIEYARYRSTKMSLKMDECEEVIFQFSEYCNHYQHESLIALAVEEVGSRVIFQDNNLKIIYSFKIDLVAEDGNNTTIFPVDHKSSSRRQDPTSLNNQFIGYCWGLDVNTIVINTIGFQKSLKPSERFQRHILHIDNDRIAEWKRNVIYWVRNWLEMSEIDYYPMNYTSCKGQFPCQYISICEANPEARDWRIERDYIIGEKWDPSENLENKSKELHQN